MKKMKYLFAGIFAFSVALGVNAQTVDYKEALKPITTALEASSTDPKVLKDLVKTYKKQFKKNPAAIVALGYSYFGVKDYTTAIECADLALKINNKFGDAAFILYLQQDAKNNGDTQSKNVANDKKRKFRLTF